MLSLTVDAALNLLWLAISVSALLWFSQRGSNRGRLRRFFAVCMMAVAIFPSVSDSDDLLNFSLLRIPTNHRGGVGTVPTPEDSREKDNLHLARTLETLEHYQVSGFYIISLALFCLGAMVSVRPICGTRVVCCNSGRAPPLV
ncbi:MAG: hypothetical protein JWP63_6472 [Candidatus Solibacter sp.]|nr:hypothetical protein [Candidatus Solibacter sp.]